MCRIAKSSVEQTQATYALILQRNERNNWLPVRRLQVVIAMAVKKQASSSVRVRHFSGVGADCLLLQHAGMLGGQATRCCARSFGVSACTRRCEDVLGKGGGVHLSDFGLETRSPQISITDRLE
ncbi:hypothetical protein NQ317_003061 [Molorchus minor]|uniref:Uncharacterized protein n=1 Tax=Molorchus minor TaxID=1323400 RepID=A0ABQ9IRI1_9CUCU|nr:hypothetical protein NQ317_003061 [Molorchus minor]